MKTLVLSFLLFFTLQSFASDENQTLLLTVTNYSKSTFQFSHVESCNPGNHFDLGQSIIQPGETMILTAHTELLNDIFGNLIFRDEKNNRIVLGILDKERRHYGQPIFFMKGKNHSSKVTSKSLNSNRCSRCLMYVAATIVVNDR